MATKRSRTKAHRRDRRRAKASDWTRPGKCNMGSRVGHGPGPSPQVEVITPEEKPDPYARFGRLMLPEQKEIKPSSKGKPTLTVPLVDFTDAHNS